MRAAESATTFRGGRRVAAAVVLSWIGTAGACLLYLALGDLIEHEGDWRSWSAGLAAVAVLSGTAAAVPIVTDGTQRRVEHSVRERIQDRLLAADTAIARARLPAAGRVVSTAVDAAGRVAALRGGFVGAIVAAGTSPLLVLVVLAVTVSTTLAGVLLILVLVAPILVWGFQRLFRRSSAQYRAQSRRLAGEFLEALRGLRTVSLLGRTAEQRAHLATESEAQRRAVMRLLLGNQIVLLVTDIVFFGGLVGTVTAVGTHLGGVGELTAGRGVALVLLAALLTAPIAYVGQFFYIGMSGAAAQREAASLIDDLPDTGQAPAINSAPPADSGPVACALRDVDFSYPRRSQLLSRFSLEVAAGECVALTGPSGVGKSTVLALVSGDLRPDAGSVVFDGSPVDPRTVVAVVHQNTYLFSGSVAGNLRLAAPDASDAELWTVLDRVHLADEIRLLPAGLHTEVGEFGSALSGGQAQRLSLARALLRDAPVLVLDEPTSHIDARSEALIADTLATLARRRTLVVATHSTGLLALADRTVEIGGPE
ncbi:ATP-binding cassette subfamily C protein CydD [Prescottella agglutinans]|uniref:ATP-binding cassette subfamily C protein CydD n=1 Tax=Prescottella agglutinans TaxID=1644129 RepID=A0ABT6MEG3_9NOCA|nr:ATP-binding cassette subfamily C protein CydD [Prescottella agglutinans]